MCTSIATQVVNLSPGELFVGGARHRVHTLLGSCVSVTLWHPQQRVGAMSHFLLAERQRPRGRDEPLDGRYGDEALQLMVQGLAAHGVQAHECMAKAFGGANMFSATRGAEAVPAGLVGQRNGETAMALLQALNVPIVGRSLYGARHRKLVFDIATGDVWSAHTRSGPQVNESEPMPRSRT